MTTTQSQKQTVEQVERHRTQLLSVRHAAEQLDVSRGHIYHLIAAGKLRTVEVKASGSRAKTRVYAAELEDFIARMTSEVRS